MDISGLDKATVLAALYNRAQVQGMGIFHYDPKPMSVEEARRIISGQTYFEYVKGRVMKVDLSGDTLDTRLYNRDNGFEAAEKALEELAGSA